jgi:hypothetical protein
MGGSIMASIINASTSGAGGVITTADASGQLELQTAGTTAVTIDTNQRVAFVAGTAAAPAITTTGDTNTGIFFPAADTIAFTKGGTEAMRIDSGGAVLVGTTTNYSIASSTATGFKTVGNGQTVAYASGDTPLFVGRQTNDGTLIDFRQAGVSEGSISVSGTTVSYNGGHLSRWSQLYNETTQVEVYRGTVLESVNAMCEWYDEEGNLLPNEQATKTIVSTTPASKAVAGVFDMYDLDDEDNPYDFYVAQSGDFVIRVAAGTVVQNGDLLESAGDGTARVQADDICRSSTIAKVTSNYVSETYADGSFCVPCILMIG